MPTGLLCLHLGLVLTAFLAMLNGYLRGSAKPAIDAVVSAVWLGTLVAALLVFGWRASLAGLALSFVYGAVTRPIARAVARRLLGYRTTLSSGVEGDTTYSLAGMLRRSEETARRVSAIAQAPEVAAILAKNGRGPEDLSEQFWFLAATGLGDLSWEIIASPIDLQRLLDLRKEGVPALEIAVQLMRH